MSYEPTVDVLDELAAMGEFGGFSAPAVASRCPVTPMGWHQCTRSAGHEGPCAHWPMISVSPSPLYFNIDTSLEKTMTPPAVDHSKVTLEWYKAGVDTPEPRRELLCKTRNFKHLILSEKTPLTEWRIAKYGITHWTYPPQIHPDAY